MYVCGEKYLTVNKSVYMCQSEVCFQVMCQSEVCFQVRKNSFNNRKILKVI